MPIIASELKFYGSVHVGSDSIPNLGGAIDVGNEITDNVLHNLFDVVDSAEAVAGATNYRCIYVKNTNLTLTLANPLVYIQAASSYIKNVFGLAVETVAINADAQTIPDELTAPGGGVVFSTVVGVGAGLNLPGDLPADQSMAIWLRRVVQADSTAQSSVSASIALQGDTT